MESAVPAATDHRPPGKFAAFVLTLVGLLHGGCATVSPGPPVAAIDVAVPAAVAAWACAEVLRAEAPGADPLPWHAGALATAQAGGFAVAQGRDRFGRWRPRANTRLLPAVDAGGALSIRLEAVVTIAGDGRDGGERRLTVMPTGPRQSRIELHADRGDATRILKHLRTLLDTIAAVDGDPAAPLATGCCVRHAGWTARAWLLVAARHRTAGDLDAALAAARTATALAPGLAEPRQPLGALAHTVTAAPAAADAALVAMLLASDPVSRAACARSLTATHAPQPLGPGDALRAEAEQLQRQGDAAAARRVRANAMALQPDTVADLRLRRDEAARHADHRRALESLLLLREYGAEGGAEQLMRGYEAAHLPGLAARCMMPPAEGTAPHVAPLSRLGPLATPGR